MDRFELRESTVRRSFIAPQYNTGRSFISTALVSDSTAFNDDLRKSRIQNLPNYKKTNLGDNISFIVVFQTIEIERLSREIQLLRVKLKQAERQLFNAQNYQVQIRQLTEKCFSDQNRLAQYEQECDKLNKICESLYHDNEHLKNQLNEMDFSLKQKYESQKQKSAELLQQIQKWKTRYQASQKSKSKELQELRNLMDSQRKSMIDRQIRQMSIRFLNERSSLQNEIRKSRQMLINRNSEIQDFKQKLQRYQIQIMELRNNQNIIIQYENKIVMVTNEVARLAQVLRSKDDEIQGFKKRQYDLNIKIKEQRQWETDNKNLKLHLQAKSKQIEEWKARASRLEEQAIRGKEMVHYNNELTEKLDLASKQLERLNNLLRVKLDDIDKWKQRMASKDAELSQLKNLQNDLAQYQTKANINKAQNERLSGILRSRLEQIESWKKKYAELESNQAKLNFIEKDKKILEEKYNNQIKNNEQMKFAFGKLQADNNAYKKFQQRCRQLQAKLQATIKEIERLNQIIRSKDQQLNDNRVKFNKYESSINQFKNIQIFLKDNQNKIALLTQQIERLNNLIQNKNQDIKQLQKQQIQLHSAINRYKNYEIKIQENQQIVAKLMNNIDISKKDIENWQNKLRSAEAKNKQLQNLCYSASQQKQKVGNIARSKTQQCEELKNKINFFQNEVKKGGQLQIVCQELHKQNLINLNDLQNIERKFRQTDGLLAKERSNNQELKNKLGSTASELERLAKELKNNVGMKSKQFMELQEHYSRLQSKVKSKDTQIEILTSKIAQIQSQCSSLMKQFNRLLEAVEQSFKQSVVMGQRIEEYQDYARRIHILGAELDRLSQLNKGLEQDNKTMRLKYANNMSSQMRQQQFNLTVIIMAAEIESLRSRLQQRELNLDQMRKSILQPIRKI